MQLLPAPGPQGSVHLPPEAAPYLWQLRHALARYRTTPHPDELGRAFSAASAVISALMGAGDGGRPDLAEMRRLAGALPEFGQLVAAAAVAAERAADAASAELWARLGLASPPPGWTAAEREAAEMVFACACAQGEQADPDRLRAGLRAIAAPRHAEIICGELAASEPAWVAALGDRYDSVRHRCAPRTAWRSRGLSELFAADEAARRAVVTRLTRWLALGGEPATLPAELEAAVVHARTPARFA